MSERDELAELIRDSHLNPKAGESAWDSQRTANRILAAGYRKPRTITTAEELDALAEGTRIVDKAELLTLEETSMECLEWVDRHGTACWVELPATVLYEPTA